ncbi:unnamed protein product, partial [marine sediment metagenome]
SGYTLSVANIPAVLAPFPTANYPLSDLVFVLILPD